jgi:hypothetical protein
LEFIEKRLERGQCYEDICLLLDPDQTFAPFPLRSTKTVPKQFGDTANSTNPDGSLPRENPPTPPMTKDLSFSTSVIRQPPICQNFFSIPGFWHPTTLPRQHVTHVTTDEIPHQNQVTANDTQEYTRIHTDHYDEMNDHALLFLPEDDGININPDYEIAHQVDHSGDATIYEPLFPNSAPFNPDATTYQYWTSLLNSQNYPQYPPG